MSTLKRLVTPRDEAFNLLAENAGYTLFLLGPLGQLDPRQRLLIGATIPGTIRVGDALATDFTPKFERQWRKTRADLQAAFERDLPARSRTEQGEK